MEIIQSTNPRELLQLLDAELREDYLEMYDGDESELGDFPTELLEDYGELYVAYIDGEIAGCGGWVWIDQLGYTHEQLPGRWPAATAEVKRVFVRKQFRRQGVASALDERIFAGAFAAGAVLVVGETGRAQQASQKMRINQPHMIPVEPFGKYHRDLGSLFFGRWRP